MKVHWLIVSIIFIMGPPFLLSEDKQYLSASSTAKILRVNCGIVTVAKEGT